MLCSFLFILGLFMDSYVAELKQIRFILGLTQDQLALKLKMNRVSISKMERSLMPIDIRTIYSLRYLHLEFCAKSSGVPWRYSDFDTCSMKQQNVVSCDTTSKNKEKRLRKKKK